MRVIVCVCPVSDDVVTIDVIAVVVVFADIIVVVIVCHKHFTALYLYRIYSFYRSIDVMLTMGKKRYRLGGMSVIAAGKCTDTAHHCGHINARRTRVGRRVQSAVRCFKVKSLWLDT